LVTASGFLTDSYNLFASNVLLPSLAFVYFSKPLINGQPAPSTTPNSQPEELAINAITLAGSAVGQVFFGVFADRFGRQKLYGIELVIVVFSTIGLAQSAYGFRVSDPSSPLDGSTSMAYVYQ